jgi:DNA-binding response OmpR family regulator
MLPKIDGLSVIRKMRREKSQVPVLLLSAMASVDNRVAGLQAGADDYLTKPFAFSELLARIQALIRRATHIAEPTTLVVGDLSMNLLTREVTRADQRIELQSREFALLELLMRHPGRPVTKTMILEHIWGFGLPLRRRGRCGTNAPGIHESFGQCAEIYGGGRGGGGFVPFGRDSGTRATQRHRYRNFG